MRHALARTVFYDFYVCSCHSSLSRFLILIKVKMHRKRPGTHLMCIIALMHNAFMVLMPQKTVYVKNGSPSGGRHQLREV